MYILESTLPASVAHADPVPSLNSAILFLPTNSYSHHPDNIPPHGIYRLFTES